MDKSNKKEEDYSVEYAPKRQEDISEKDEIKQKAEKAVDKAVHQLIASTDFKRPRMERIVRYWQLYDGKTQKKLRQLFNVPIPVFPGMIDTLNAQYDAPIQLKFKEGDASDYFKVKKLNGAWQMEMVDTAQNSKWEGKIRMLRHQAIMVGRGIVRYTASSDPEYKSQFDIVNAKYFHCQPRGGVYLENHLFCGEENIQRTKEELENNSDYDQEQVKLLISRCNEKEYLPDNSTDIGMKLERFRPLGLYPDNNNYVGEPIYNICEWILRIDGVRYYLVFHPWSKTWLRFEKWSNIDSSNLLPWKSFATHPDEENFWSKSYADDLYPSADAIVAMFNQELTNREKRNFGARAYDKDMFKDVRRLDESMHRPDALVPADTKGGTKQIAQGIYEFKVGDLGGTVNLIDWITGTVGRTTGATELSQGNVQEVSKKASVTFAEQKAVSKRIGWGSQPFQEMMADLGKSFIYGLRDHMPAKMAIRVLGENGWDWDEITRLDLDTTKDIDVTIISTDKEVSESEMRLQRRKDALTSIGADPLLAKAINPIWRAEEILKSIGQYDDSEVATALDTKTFSDKKALAKASEAIVLISKGEKPELWYGANVAFLEKIVNFAMDNKSTLKDKFAKLLDYAMAHKDIAEQNMIRKAKLDAIGAKQAMVNENPTDMTNTSSGAIPAQNNQNMGISGGMSRAMNIANANS